MNNGLKNGVLDYLMLLLSLR